MEHVIELTIQGWPAWYAIEGVEWDGTWYTRDLANARRYKRASNAQAVINSFGTVWADYTPTVKPI